MLAKSLKPGTAILIICLIRVALGRAVTGSVGCQGSRVEAEKKKSPVMSDFRCNQWDYSPHGILQLYLSG